MTSLVEPAASFASDYEMSEVEFKFIAEKVNSDFGLSIGCEKLGLIQSRLSKRLRVLGIDSFEAYCSLLETPNGQQEAMHMLSALTTNVTHFFREMHHFDALSRDILPSLRETAETGGRIRMWSAGCSAGQEPLSIAATVLKSWPDAAGLDCKILATDIDPEVLEIARAATYQAEEIEKIPTLYRDLIFSKGASEKTASKEITKLIKFGRLNLISNWPMTGKFDVIFCRNVAIYFDKSTQIRLWERFHDILSPGGTLCIGHSERLSGDIKNKFKSAGVTIYRRIDN